MYGAGFAYLLTQVKSFLQRQALIYGLVAVAGLILIFAGGYGLDAVRETLMVRVGGGYASLIVGGALLTLALICVGIATYLGRSSGLERAQDQASASSSGPPRRPIVSGPAILTGGVVTGLVAGVLAAKRPSRNGTRMRAETGDERVHHAPRR